MSKAEMKATIFYHDIGDYLSREEKLAIIREKGSIANMEWQMLSPNEHGDWLNQRNDAFSSLIPLAPEKKFDEKTQSFFSTYAVGTATGRDAWVINFSKKELCKNMKRMIDFYNEQIGNTDIDLDSEKISWTVNLKKDAEQGKIHKFYENKSRISMYRPFTKQWLYYDKSFVERPGLWKQFFPTKNHNNLVICLSCEGSTKELSVIITDKIANHHLAGDTQGFPLYYYEENENPQQKLFAEAEENKYIRHDAISDFILKRCREQYGKNVSKEDIFYYVYGFLHSPEYKKTFANDLKKMLPRLPLADNANDFWAFSKAGRELAELHLNYESLGKHPSVIENATGDSDFCVEKMRFPSKADKSKIIYNNRITVENIPAQAYEYVVNGKSAVEWVMERYQKTKHKESGIENDPNDWAKEAGNPRYILDLLHGVINLSVKTAEIVKGLPGVGVWG